MSRSLLHKHLTPQVWHLLKDLHTSTGVSLRDCIASGLAHTDSVIGVYAGDAESLERFGLLFAPLIQELHAPAPTSLVLCSAPDEDEPNLFNPDPQGTFIRSTRIRLARNLSGFRLMPTMSSAELLEVQRQLVAAFETLDQDLAGSYQALGAWQCNATASSAGPPAGFDGTDRFQQAAGICRSWPEGRGAFHNHARTLQLWVNEEDHLRMIAVQDGADMRAVYARLVRASQHLEKSLHFAQSPRYGYLASCPSNVGTGLRASFHIHLPHSGSTAAFRRLCSSHAIAVRSASGELGPQHGAVYDISNRRRWGISPVDSIRELLRGTVKIIALEKQMQLAHRAGLSP